MKKHIPLGVGFYPDWFYLNYGISFGRDYYYDPDTRVQARLGIEKALYDRFGDVGLGSRDPQPKPLITFGMVMLPAVFGCEIVFKDDALPWAMPLNLSEKEVMRLKVPDLLNTPPMSDMIRQIDYLKSKYGRVIGDINTTGVQNLALKLRGDQLYFDYFERPDLCRHLLRICTETMLELFRFNHSTTGTSAVDVTPMCNPSFYVLPNCTIEQVSLAIYEDFLLEYDNMIAEQCHPLGIHHCGSVNEVLAGYAKVKNLAFLEVGFGSNVKRTREVLGPDVAVNARINPVLMKNGRPEEVEAEVKRLIDQGHPLENFSIDTVGLTHGTPDENVRVALATAAEYGRLDGGKGRLYSFPAGGSREDTILRGSGREVVIGPERPLAVIGERINPTGRKALASSLERGDLSLVLKEASAQIEAGALILDVNVGVSGIDEVVMLREATKALQELTDLPLCLDSANPHALEAALEVYKGKAIINSVNGETRKLSLILPLARRYKAAVIGLTMDDKGIPPRAEDRVEIAELIVRRAEAEGIPKCDVIIDPLAMAVSSDHSAGLETLKALTLIRDRLKVNQTLGLSNVSFGLPERPLVNALFLAMAASSGMTCPILDPTDPSMKKALLTCEMLLGRDDHCMGYLGFFGKKGPARDAEGLKRDVPKTTLEELKEAVVAGKKRLAVELTRRALSEGEDARRVVDEALIAGLNLVGERFERREIFVPEMMISAKTMQSCMEEVKPFLLSSSAEGVKGFGTVVIGTVFGDLHDIGKNLTKLLLESSGFRVVDLGENVPAQRFLEAAEKEGAQVVGISSLLTTGDPYVLETVQTIKQSRLAGKVKVICGGAALTRRFAVEICGADAYAKDAADGVKRIKELLSAKA